VLITGIITGKQGAKTKFTNILCPNEDCKFYGVPGKAWLENHG
jgi:hypothetical protein